MTKFFIALTIACLTAAPFETVAGPLDKAVRLIVTVAAGFGAAKTLENASQAEGVHREKESVIDNLRSQGIDPTGGAIYSVYVKCDPEASAIKWSRIFSMPNLFVVPDIEGQGAILLPKIQMDYRGQPILENMIAKNAAPGRRIVIYVLDDKQFENTIWNRIVQTKIDFNAATGITALKALPVSVQATGTLQLLDRDVTIVEPGYLAYAEFRVPESGDGCWLAKAAFLDKHTNSVGNLEFAQIWKADPRLPAESRDASSSAIFWSAGSVVLILVFGKLLLRACPKRASFGNAITIADL